MFKRVAAVLLLGLISFTSMAADSVSREEMATISAQKWLEMMDVHAWDKVWGGSSEFFRKEMPVDHWGRMVVDHRKPLGKFISRKLQGTEYKNLKEGTLPGEYIVVKFASSYEKKAVIEVVVTYKEKDGVWRSSGYLVADGKS